MRKEIEFLQGSFASYKTTVHLDQDEKWKKREHDMTMLMEENKQTAVHELSEYIIVLVSILIKLRYSSLRHR